MKLPTPVALEQMAAELRAYAEPAVSQPPTPGKWSAKEILGHLLDSAVNNHVRFIRAQAENPLHIAPYDQNHWNRVQAYVQGDWTALVDLWLAYNLHLRRVLELVPEGAYTNEIIFTGAETFTLQYVAEDYYRHMEHHLIQIRAALHP